MLVHLGTDFKLIHTVYCGIQAVKSTCCLFFKLFVRFPVAAAGIRGKSAGSRMIYYRFSNRFREYFVNVFIFLSPEISNVKRTKRNEN